MSASTTSRAPKARDTPKKTAARTPVKKMIAKPNGSILSFFKKVEVEVEETLFVANGLGRHVDNEDLYGVDDDVDERSFDESGTPAKKRRLSSGDWEGSSKENHEPPAALTMEDKARPERQPVRRSGPFLDDTDSEEEGDFLNESRAILAFDARQEPVPHADLSDMDSKPPSIPLPPDPAPESAPANDECPTATELSNFEDFGDVDDFGDDEELGEEYREMRFMQEQARLEAEEAGNYSCDDVAELPFGEDSMVENCPICDGSLVGISPDDATKHVNACLDGNPIPLSSFTNSLAPEPAKVEAPEVARRFARNAIARPGQTNPFNLSGSGSTVNSAFAKLMSGHAESAAWTTAAAAENSSRGKPAYMRTCPFYKIMPGFFICVDAFRYGAVKGCNAYFLSHFHSDHYVGLTANWSHGPIYCSEVTGSLVKHQLRVDAKWVKVLEFEETVEVPGTEGVTVTMIPANHCPGSSLFLFQKTLGRGPNARIQRILHCGDFRACPGHITHPLLKPEVIDSISGKVKQQKIDICYLDTTYLNPRYSFPPQDDVIRACAELCASMSPDPNSPDDIWDKLGREIGSSTVSKYFAAEKSNGDKAVPASASGNARRNRILVVCGTYSIGKERICVAIAKALGTKIFASASKIKVCSMLGDAELSSLMTPDPREAQVHMQMLMEIRAETLQEYLDEYRPYFSRIVGFRPSGWNYRPTGAGKLLNANTQPSTVPTAQLLHGKVWRSRFGVQDFVPQRGSTREAMCFGVPYSEHSSFRELAMFLMALRIERVVPTVNVGSEVARNRMKGWIDRWMAERRRGGLLKALEGDEDEQTDAVLWEGKEGKGGGAWW